MSYFSSPFIIQNKGLWPSGKAPVPNDPSPALALCEVWGPSECEMADALPDTAICQCKRATGGLGDTGDPEFESQRVHFYFLSFWNLASVS
jgi:hypothetical protein